MSFGGVRQVELGALGGLGGLGSGTGGAGSRVPLRFGESLRLEPRLAFGFAHDESHYEDRTEDGETVVKMREQKSTNLGGALAGHYLWELGGSAEGYLGLEAGGRAYSQHDHRRFPDAGGATDSAKGPFHGPARRTGPRWSLPLLAGLSTRCGGGAGGPLRQSRWRARRRRAGDARQYQRGPRYARFGGAAVADLMIGATPPFARSWHSDILW